MKVKVTYPQVVANTIEIDIPEEELKEDMNFDEKFNLVIKYSAKLPSYDIPEYFFCRDSDEAEYIKFKIEKV